jgi:hypothetical protein
MLTEIMIRVIVGGVIVSIFAILGDILKPKSFAGLFGAARDYLSHSSQGGSSLRSYRSTVHDRGRPGLLSVRLHRESFPFAGQMLGFTGYSVGPFHLVCLGPWFVGWSAIRARNSTR